MQPAKSAQNHHSYLEDSAGVVRLFYNGTILTCKCIIVAAAVAFFEASNPSPISTPLTAPMETTAFAREASSLSKTVSPIPAGMPLRGIPQFHRKNPDFHAGFQIIGSFFLHKHYLAYITYFRQYLHNDIPFQEYRYLQ